MEFVDCINEYRHRIKFTNGWTASVVSHSGSYGGRDGLFEVALFDREGDICYHEVTDHDVVGYLDFWGVVKVLDKIKNLPPA